MRKIVFVCDRCKKEVTVAGILLNAFELNNGETEVYGESRHICNECADSLAAWMRGDETALQSFQKVAPEQKTAKKDPARKSRPVARRLAISTSDILRMKEDGMTIEQIAERLGCSEATISNRLREVKDGRND